MVLPSQLNVSSSTTQDSDPVWARLRREAEKAACAEPLLAGYLHDNILRHQCLKAAVSYFLASKLASPFLGPVSLRDVFYESLAASADLLDAVRRDLSAVVERDPAARSLVQPFLYFKGFHALQAYRIAHFLWTQERQPLALYLQNRISEAFDVDIHPAASIGKGILIDHGTSVVIGETAVVGDDVSMLHEVTLGGTGKEVGDRHPKVGKGVLIGAGAKILGNIKIGEGAKIAAGSVVLKEVPPHTTVAGVPAKVVGKPKSDEPGLQMDQDVEAD
ncbi:MAG: serine O-acetyltransferase [Desulfuromonas sp.]|nr:serine O-acetyltransferase [Desulfuromonas sp.]